MQKTVGARNTRRARETPEVGRTGARFGPPGRWRIEPAGDEPEPDAPADDSPIGLTGARFGGAARKRRRAKAPRPTESAEPTTESAPAPVAVPVARTESAAQWWDADTPVDPDDDHWSEEYSDWLTRPESHALVRPYAWTGGRTRADGDLAVEALVHTERGCARPSWELRAITELCVRPKSVAEVAALMAVPLGVARVLIADLAAEGAVRVHGVAGGAPDLAVMNRVLIGLRRL
ncbi:DUF742 domain-containing protein [Actinokineospora guangxiensis]|uniref:DUF742 domain-containing protein n=1 Tax=Actinokineospora guangxiensis TaxID=1490288 RepID=A0ABW0ETJ4_9PSEU